MYKQTFRSPNETIPSPLYTVNSSTQVGQRYTREDSLQNEIAYFATLAGSNVQFVLQDIEPRVRALRTIAAHFADIFLSLARHEHQLGWIRVAQKRRSRS